MVSRRNNTIIWALYEWMLKIASYSRAQLWLGIVSFLEGFVFPIPIEAMMLPMMFARPKLSIRYAWIATLTSVAGGLMGYAIGVFLFEVIGKPILVTYGYETDFTAFHDAFRTYGWLIVFIGGFTPLPYKVITIASGAMALDLTIFLVASLVARGLRYGLLGMLVFYRGDTLRAFIEKRLEWATIIGGLLLIAGFLILHYA